MMLAILMMAMLADLVFLAAMFNTPLGYVFEPKRKPKNPRPESGPGDSEQNYGTLLSSDHRLDAAQTFPPPVQRKKDSSKMLLEEK